MNQKECINVKFSEGQGIFDDHYGYPVVDDQEKYNGPTGKVVDIQGRQAHAGRDFFVPEGKELRFDIDECAYLHIAIKAGKDTDTCLFLLVHDKEPDDHKNRFVVIGKTPGGNPGIYQVIKGCFTIKDDGEWHEYDFDLGKIRGNHGYPSFPNACSIRIIQFYSWTGSGKHSFHFNDFICKQEQSGTTPGFVVQGTIRQADGTPFMGCIVRAFDKDLRQEEQLGEIVTDKTGQYKITYTAEQFCRAEKKSADLVVKVVNQENSSLAASQVFFNAESEKIVDLEVSKDKWSVPSEYEKIVNEISPLLGDQKIADLKEDDEDKPEAGKFQDITFLSGETGISAQHLSFLVQAAKLGRQTEIDPEIFYGLFRQNFPLELSALLAQDIQIHRLALKKSLSDNIIPSRFQDKLEGVLQILHGLPDTSVLKKSIFLVRPDVLFNNLIDLKALDKEEAGFVGMKLNEHFRGELLKSAGTVSEAMNHSLRTAFARIDYQNVKDSEQKAIFLEMILPEIKKDKALAQEISEIEKRIANLPSQKISDLLYLNVPLQDNPVFHTEVKKARTLTYARLVKLSDETARQLIDKNLYLDDADETMLDDLVNQKIINTQQKEELILTIDLGRLTGDNIPFINALKTSEITSIASMVSWEKKDWQQRIAAAKITLPPGETLESYVENILLNIEKTYPSQVLFSNLIHPRQIARIDRLDSINPFLSSHDRLIDGIKPAYINWGNIPAKGRNTLQKDLEEITAFANTYRHLGIAELINDKNIDLASKKVMINDRIKLLDTFYKNNSGLDLRFVNFFDKNSGLLNWNDISPADKPLVRKQLMAHQRILNLAEETGDQQILLGKGYDSAITISCQTEAQFIKKCDLPPGKARMIYFRAQESSLSVAHSYETIHDAVWGGFIYIEMANNIGKTINDLRDIDDLGKLFGSQNYCACEECKSILSPAAYFVDLMHFIEQYVSDQISSSEPLYLKNRRGDLWKLNLTCENTSTLVPHLTIANEVLEEYLETELKGDIFERLSNIGENISFDLPFNLPLEELRIYLSHFGITIHDLYQTLKQPDQKIWRAKLNLSNEEYGIIKTPLIDEVKFHFGKTTTFTNLNVQEFIRRAVITRKQLDEILALSFNTDLKDIKVEKEINPEELQNFEEILKNLTDVHLDFIHRFIRLWRKTEWTIPELDSVLSALKEAKLIWKGQGMLDEMNEFAILYIAKLIDLQGSLKLTVQAVPKPLL